MERSTSTLVLVAHPGDETLAFSTVCAGADVVSVTDGSWPGFAEEFRGACDRLGAKRAFSLSLPNIDPWRLPKEVLVGRLKALGPYSRILYTQSLRATFPSSGRRVRGQSMLRGNLGAGLRRICRRSVCPFPISVWAEAGDSKSDVCPSASDPC